MNSPFSAGEENQLSTVLTGFFQTPINKTSSITASDQHSYGFIPILGKLGLIQFLLAFQKAFALSPAARLEENTIISNSYNFSQAITKELDLKFERY